MPGCNRCMYTYTGNVLCPMCGQPPTNDDPPVKPRAKPEPVVPFDWSDHDHEREAIAEAERDRIIAAIDAKSEELAAEARAMRHRDTQRSDALFERAEAGEMYIKLIREMNHPAPTGKEQDDE